MTIGQTKYQFYPEKTAPTLSSCLFEEIDQIPSSSAQEVDILFKKKKPIAFCIYEKQLDHNHILQIKKVELLCSSQKHNSYFIKIANRLLDIAQTLQASSIVLPPLPKEIRKIFQRCFSKRDHANMIEMSSSKRANNVSLHQLTMKKCFIEQIRREEKSVEGRIAIDRLKKLSVGDRIRFYYYSNASDDVTCTITAIESFNGFEEMLNEVGFKRCIPHAESIYKALSLYHNIPGYREKAEKFGVTAIHIKPVKGEDYE